MTTPYEWILAATEDEMDAEIGHRAFVAYAREALAGEWSDDDMRDLPVLLDVLDVMCDSTLRSDARQRQRLRKRLGMARPRGRRRVSDDEASERTLSRRRSDASAN